MPGVLLPCCRASLLIQFLYFQMSPLPSCCPRQHLVFGLDMPVTVVGLWIDWTGRRHFRVARRGADARLCAEQYVPLQNKLLGKGAYGHVCAVRNTETNEHLAVKKVKNAFEDVIDAKRVLREIRLLCTFDHENVLSIKDLQMPKDEKGNHEDIYIITELLDTDLSKVTFPASTLTSLRLPSRPQSPLDLAERPHLKKGQACARLGCLKQARNCKAGRRAGIRGFMAA